MNSTIELVKQLRSETGAGAMECYKALEQSNSYDEARALLYEKAALNTAKQAEQETLQGRLEVYSHNNGRIGVIVEVNCQTEFASRSETLRHFAHEMALQIAAAAPQYVRDEDIPRQTLDEQALAATDRARQAGKSERVIEQMVDGALSKYKNQHVLLRQPYIRDENLSVAQLVSRTAGQLGENIVIRRFIRWEICAEAEGKPLLH